MGKKEEGFAFLGAVTAECKEEAIPVTHTANICPAVLPEESHFIKGEGHQGFWYLKPMVGQNVPEKGKSACSSVCSTA